MTVSNDPVMPEIGMGATIAVGSDCFAATVISISKGGNKIVLQEDKATRTDTNGMSESQSYDYERDENGSTYSARMHRNGAFYLTRSRQRIGFGYRRKFHDYSF